MSQIFPLKQQMPSQQQSQILGGIEYGLGSVLEIHLNHHAGELIDMVADKPQTDDEYNACPACHTQRDPNVKACNWCGHSGRSAELSVVWD